MRAKRTIFFVLLAAVGCQDADLAEESESMLGEPEGLLAQAAEAPSSVRQPAYDEAGRLVRPTDTDRWVFLGTGVNLNYTEGMGPGNFMSTVHMEPSAYQAYLDTGVFPEGTMTALTIYRAGSGLAPAKSGQYLGDRLGFEMSVKDSKKNPKDVWTYYGFRGDSRAGDANPPERCQACHEQHAATDLVFTQFYPNLRKLPARTR